MVFRTLNPVSSAIVPYKYEKYSSPTDMYEKYHLVSSTYLPRLNKGEAKLLVTITANVGPYLWFTI